MSDLKRSLSDFFGENLTEDAMKELEWVGDQAAKDLTKSIYGQVRGEVNVITSPTGRTKSRLMVNLPGDKDVVGVLLPEFDFTRLEEKVEALMASQESSSLITDQTWPKNPLIFSESDNIDMNSMKSISSLLKSADRVIGIERSVATPGQTFQLFNSRTGKETTYQLKDTGDWEDVH